MDGEVTGSPGLIQVVFVFSNDILRQSGDRRAEVDHHGVYIDARDFHVFTIARMADIRAEVGTSGALLTRLVSKNIEHAKAQVMRVGWLPPARCGAHV